MDPDIVGQLIPLVAIVSTFGMPVGIVFLVKHFKYKQLELDAELQARKLISERDRAELEKRIERLESVIMGANSRPPLESNARFTNVAGPVAVQAAPERAGLYEAPASAAPSADPASLPPLREKA